MRKGTRAVIGSTAGTSTVKAPPAGSRSSRRRSPETRRASPEHQDWEEHRPAVISGLVALYYEYEEMSAGLEGQPAELFEQEKATYIDVKSRAARIRDLLDTEFPEWNLSEPCD
ncbi:MAG TPA: hypothetical protein VGS41_12935 [Chthonomonadales bacterium]|nr:hypothetical protein [Chthonomonadales bacterium]